MSTRIILLFAFLFAFGQTSKVLTAEQSKQIIQGIVLAAFQKDVGDVKPCLSDFDDFNSHIDKAVANIELNSISGKIAATGDMAACLNAINKMLAKCSSFKGDHAKLKDIASQLESPYTLYAKALISEGFQHFESTSYMETALANYKNNLFYDFGRFLGYTMYLLTGGKSAIKPANEELVKLAFTEQLTFFEHFIDNYKGSHQQGLNKSVRSISTIFTDKVKKIICQKPNYKKDQAAFIGALAHVHTFMLDTIKEREGVLDNKEQYELIRARLECLQGIQEDHINAKVVSMVEIIENGCLKKDWSKVGDFFGQIVNHYCSNPEVGLSKKSDL